MFMNQKRQVTEANDIPYKFIVVCDKFTEPIAHSLSNRAIDKNITSVVWGRKDYDDNKVRLTNRNFVLFLDEKNIKITLADPVIKPQQIVPGVFYKTQGHKAGIYIDKNSNPSKTADDIANFLKENRDIIVACFIPDGIYYAIFRAILSVDKTKRAKFYLLMKAVDTFDNNYLLDYVHGKLTQH